MESKKIEPREGRAFLTFRPRIRQCLIAVAEFLPADDRIGLVIQVQ